MSDLPVATRAFGCHHGNHPDACSDRKAYGTASFVEILTPELTLQFTVRFINTGSCTLPALQGLRHSFLQ